MNGKPITDVISAQNWLIVPKSRSLQSSASGRFRFSATW